MKKLMLLCLVLLTGCANVEEETQTQEIEKKLFDMVHDEINFYVIVDNETGVEYIIYEGYQKGGITPRYNEDGTLKVNSEWGGKYNEFIEVEE